MDIYGLIASEIAKHSTAEAAKAQSQFRIGGCYMQKNGTVIELSIRHDPKTGTAWASIAGTEIIGEGFRDLLTGADTINFENGRRSLIPGELIQRDGQWVPVEDKAATGYFSRKDLERESSTVRRAGAEFVCTVPAGLSVTNADLRMVARDEAAISKRNVRVYIEAEYIVGKPARILPHWSQRSPDLAPTSHLTDPRHALAATRS